MNKKITFKDAVKKVEDGMVIMVGGFLGVGGPHKLMEALADSGVKELTIICNDTAYDEVSHGRLFKNKQVKKVITSYVGANRTSTDQMNEGHVEVEFSPQGTLIERIRSGGAGLGGVLTPTGLGTVVAEGKEVITVDGKEYLLEKPLKADMAFLGASIADKHGNLYYKGTTRNFNPVMAMAAETVFVEPGRIVEAGEIKPEDVHTPAILVDYILI